MDHVIGSMEDVLAEAAAIGLSQDLCAAGRGAHGGVPGGNTGLELTADADPAGEASPAEPRPGLRGYRKSEGTSVIKLRKPFPAVVR